MVSLALALFSLGVAVGMGIESMRYHAVEVLHIAESSQNTIPAITDATVSLANVLEAQNKKLDTLLMCQAYVREDPEITQDIPIVRKSYDED